LPNLRLTKTEQKPNCHRGTRENWSSKMLWSSSGLYMIYIYIYDMIWWYMYISECIDINYAYVRIGVVSWIPLGPFWCGFIWMFLDSLPATILPRHGSQYSMMFQCSNFVLPADRLRRPIDHLSLSIYQSIDPSTYIYIVCPIVYLGRKSYKPRLNPFGEYWEY
jgi:hypothetical protein